MDTEGAKQKIQLWQLRQRQAMPLWMKEKYTEHRIKAWYEHYNGMVYVAFSGGKDSLVMLHLVRRIYPEVPAVFVDTGLEYPELRELVKSVDNVVWLRPQMNFKEVIEKYGYPVVSKKVARFIRDLQNESESNSNTVRLRLTGINRHGKYLPSMKLPAKWLPLVHAPFKISEQCCDVMKKQPMKHYARETGRFPYIGIMASESNWREKQYLMDGCNIYGSHYPTSQPLSFWTEQDVLKYIGNHNIRYASVYGDIIQVGSILRCTGEQRTGCMFCMFGVHLENRPNRFQRMQSTHPKQYAMCINNLGLGTVLNYIGVPYKDNQLSLNFN